MKANTRKSAGNKKIVHYTIVAISATISALCFFQFGNVPGYDWYLLAGWMVSLSVMAYSLNTLDNIEQSNTLE